jgi:hypothetical protein
MTTTIDLNKIMARVQSLLAKAESTQFPAEADAMRAGAEKLMRQYRIEEEQLIAVDQLEIAPEVHALWLGPMQDRTRATSKSRPSFSYYAEWYAMALAAAIHAGAKCHYRWGTNPETGEYGIWAVFVGYSGDVRLAELIYTNARLVFADRIEPKVNPLLDNRTNAYRLRAAGITRDRAAAMIWGETSHARAAQVGQWYKEECAARGETPALDGRGISAAQYRDTFASAFVNELERRLRWARDAADSDGGALVLHGRAERVKEAFYNEFPALRPQPATDVSTTTKTPAKKGRAAKPYWETAAYRREQERAHSGVAYAARDAGKAAAAAVPLDRASGHARVTPSPRGTSGAIEG